MVHFVQMLENFPIILAMYGDYGILALRVALGLVLVAHGMPKLRDLRNTGEWMASVGFRPGRMWAGVAAAVENVGGLLLLLGVFVQAAALFIAGEFAVILLWRLRRRDPWSAAELELMLFAASLALVTLGGGAWSVL